MKEHYDDDDILSRLENKLPTLPGFKPSEGKVRIEPEDDDSSQAASALLSSSEPGRMPFDSLNRVLEKFMADVFILLGENVPEVRCDLIEIKANGTRINVRYDENMVADFHIFGANFQRNHFHSIINGASMGPEEEHAFLTHLQSRFGGFRQEWIQNLSRFTTQKP